MKSSVCFAAVAAVAACAAIAPANAADLGRGCCADLEERVAELEATTARKGNRVVSLQVYGQVNKALLIWDDGVDSDAFVVDNMIESSRFGVTGSAKIKPGWTAGYTIEIEFDDARSNAVHNPKDGESPSGSNSLALRQNFWYIESERLGRISVGRQLTAADGATEVVVADSLRHSDPGAGAGFYLRTKAGGFSTLKLGGAASDLNPDPNNVVRYDTPAVYGFILSASWGANDTADIALRFKQEFKTLKIAAAIAHISDSQVAGGQFEQLGGSISVGHIPTGLFAAFQAGSRDYKDSAASDPSFWYVQGGIERKWLAHGVTTLYGEYGRYSDFDHDGMKATRWGLGVNQKIDAASMDIYAQATFWSFDGNAPVSCPLATVCSPAPVEDFSTVLIGSRIQF